MIKENSREYLNEIALNKNGAVEYCLLDEDNTGIFLTRVIHTIDDYEFVNHGVVVVRLNLDRLLKELSRKHHPISKYTIVG